MCSIETRCMEYVNELRMLEVVLNGSFAVAGWCLSMWVKVLVTTLFGEPVQRVFYGRRARAEALKTTSAGEAGKRGLSRIFSQDPGWIVFRPVLGPQHFIILVNFWLIKIRKIDVEGGCMPICSQAKRLFRQLLGPFHLLLGPFQ